MAPKPKFKATNPAYNVNESVWVPQGGSALVIDDPDRTVRGLIDLLDGSSAVDEIEAAFRQRYPNSSFDVRAAIAQFDEAGMIEDADAPTTLTPYELERWKRNIGFFETYASLSVNKYSMQERIRDAKVALLGLGGVGSYVSLTLLGAGVRDLRVVDFDKVELSNLNRQILYSEADIGQRKLEAALNRLQGYFPDAKIAGVEQRLTSVEDIEDIVTGRDFVFCAVDRPKMQVIHWVNEACVRAGVPFVAGGVELKQCMIYLIIPGVTGCVECWQSTYASDENSKILRAETEALHSENSGVGPDLAAFGPMVTALNSLMVTEFVRYITNIAPPIAAGRLMAMRFEDMTTVQAEQWDRLRDCHVCGAIAVHD